MSIGLQAPGWWGNSSSFDVAAPGDDTTAGQATVSTSTNDGWGEFWKSTVSQVTGYALARDVAKTSVAAQNAGIAAQYNAQAQLAQVQATAARQADPFANMGGLLPLLLVGGLIMLVVKE